MKEKRQLIDSLGADFSRREVLKGTAAATASAGVMLGTPAIVGAAEKVTVGMA